MKHRKFKKVEFDNKKRVFHLVYTSGLKIDCPYFSLGIRGKVTEAGADDEVGGHSFYFVLENGRKDYVPYDQPLHIAQNPEYVKERTLYEMTKRLNEFIKSERVSKRELARRLGTSMSQLGRLLDTANYKKELSRLIELAALLNYEFRWEFKKAAKINRVSMHGRSGSRVVVGMEWRLVFPRRSFGKISVLSHDWG